METLIPGIMQFTAVHEEGEVKDKEITEIEERTEIGTERRETERDETQKREHRDDKTDKQKTEERRQVQKRDHGRTDHRREERPETRSKDIQG
jgi:hypothetical protein